MCAISETGTEMLGINVAHPLRRKMKTTTITRPMEITMLRWASRTESRMVMVRSFSTVKSTVGGSEALNCGSICLDAFDGVDDVGVRLAADLDQNGRLAVREPHVPHVLDGIDHASQIRQAHRRAVAVDDDEIPVILRLEKLVAHDERRGGLPVVQRAFRFVGIRILEKSSDLIQPHVVPGNRLRIDFNAHGGQGTSAHLHLSDALDLRQFLRKHG